MGIPEREEVDLGQGISKFPVHTTHLEILLKCRFRFVGQEWVFLTSSQVMLRLLVHGPHFM